MKFIAMVKRMFNRKTNSPAVETVVMDTPRFAVKIHKAARKFKAVIEVSIKEDMLQNDVERNTNHSIFSRGCRTDRAWRMAFPLNVVDMQARMAAREMSDYVGEVDEMLFVYDDVIPLCDAAA